MTFVTTSDAYDVKNYTSVCRGYGDLVWKAVTSVAFVIALVALIMSANIHVSLALHFLIYYSLTGRNRKYPKSCSEITNSTSGVFEIRPDKAAPPFKVSCVEFYPVCSPLHGVNLVTSSPSERPDERNSQTFAISGSGNWANRRVFGQLEALTSQDYKNPAYMDASNVMIWHVRNGVRLSNISRAAHFKYYTANNVLTGNGQSLHRLYRDYFPIKVADGGLEPLIQKINSTSLNTTGIIPNWFNYRYSTSRNIGNIPDGGNDMYDTGNQISFQRNEENFTNVINYNTDKFMYAEVVEMTTATIYPFIALVWIGNPTGSIDTFDILVKSNYGADGGGRFRTYETSTLNVGLITAKYRAFNVYSAGDPSVCEVFFYMGSRVLWNSVFPSSMRNISWGRNTSHVEHVVRVAGRPRNIIFGYTLLSKWHENNGQLVTEEEVRAVVSEYMKAAATFQFAFRNGVLEAPASFIRGTSDSLYQTIPYKERRYVDPGFIQFRAHNNVGLPNALCPGFRTNSSNPEKLCVGGLNTRGRELVQCGDFAAWGGNRRTQPNPDPSLPTDNERSQNDIDSTLLLFVK
uniref:Uncharacterized protein n=1 Tax=Ciona savignyi TaxID=51511 RepID=H2YWI5_CIOSA